MVTICAFATAAIFIATSGAAQTSVSLSINAGSATDVTGVGSNALTIAPSFRRASGSSSAVLGASATKFANDGWSAAISTAVNSRASARTITPVIDLGFSAATTSYDFSYATADLIPSLETRVGALKFFGGARIAAAGTSSIPGTLVGPLPTGTYSTVSQTGTTGIAGVSFGTVTEAGEIAGIGYRAETGIVAGATQTDQALNASIASSSLMVAAGIGRRDRLAASTLHGSATLGMALMPGMMLQVSAGNDPSNPMLGTAAGKFVNVGLAMRLGRTSGLLPTPSNVHPPSSGWTRLTIQVNQARRVELAGDFSKWQPIAAARADNGVWYVDLDLPPGEYRYAFRVDGKEWRVPEGVAAVDDEFGGKSAWLRVSRSASNVSR